MNEALAEIEKLHGIIEQEEEANAKLAASLSDILREQALPCSPDTDIGDFADPSDATVAKIKRIKQEVTQMEANNAMEKDMSEHLIDRLKKDNEVLRSKLAAMTHAIEACCTPSRNTIMQNLVTGCPPGLGRGASGTPHEVALARARRLVDSPASEDSPKDESVKTSRFAREIATESPKVMDGGKPSSLREVSEVDPIDLLTPGTATDASHEDKQSSPAVRRSPRRRSPRKRGVDDTPQGFQRVSGEEGQEDQEEPELSPRVSKRAGKSVNSKKKSAAKKENREDSPQATAPKTRKLLSTAKKQPLTASKQTPMRILGVSNSAKRSRRLGGLPTAEELGLKS